MFAVETLANDEHALRADGVDQIARPTKKSGGITIKWLASRPD